MGLIGIMFPFINKPTTLRTFTQPLGPTDRAMVRRLYLEGKGVTEISKRTRFAPSVIRQLIRAL